ncbi:hypothetical protein [Pediococcus acidilactici]|uniref:hypothetical protein n=1 Tax=Pediococcus acidilactici TaxID=1254 RepID=UPI00132F8E01|nr:hypothetical protein [Pediococcus acidilactici]
MQKAVSVRASLQKVRLSQVILSVNVKSAIMPESGITADFELSQTNLWHTFWFY